MQAGMRGRAARLEARRRQQGEQRAQQKAKTRRGTTLEEGSLASVSSPSRPADSSSNELRGATPIFRDSTVREELSTGPSPLDGMVREMLASKGETEAVIKSVLMLPEEKKAMMLSAWKQEQAELRRQEEEARLEAEAEAAIMEQSGIGPASAPPSRAPSIVEASIDPAAMDEMVREMLAAKGEKEQVVKSVLALPADKKALMVSAWQKEQAEQAELNARVRDMLSAKGEKEQVIKSVLALPADKKELMVSAWEKEQGEQAELNAKVREMLEAKGEKEQVIQSVLALPADKKAFMVEQEEERLEAQFERRGGQGKLRPKGRFKLF